MWTIISKAKSAICLCHWPEVTAKKYYLTKILKSQLSEAPALGKDCRNNREQPNIAMFNSLKWCAQLVWSSHCKY